MIPKNFSRTLHYTRRAPAAHILADMAQLETLDRLYEGRERAWKICLILALALGLPGVFLVLALTDNQGPGWFLVLLVSTLLLAGVAVIRWRACRRFNLENRRYQLVRQLLQYLSRDMSPGQPCSVSIDFNDYYQAKYCSARPGRGRLSTPTLSSYRLPWLTCDGTLLDGNRFCLSTTMLVKRKTRRKRKYVKVRESFHEEVLLKLRISPRRYPRTVQLPQLLARPVFVPEARGLRFKGARMRGPWCVLRATTQRQIRVRGRAGTSEGNATAAFASQHAILGMFLACYTALAQCASGS